MLQLMDAVTMRLKCDVIDLCVISPLIDAAIPLTQAVFVVVIFEVQMLVNAQYCVHSIVAPPIRLQYLRRDGDRAKMLFFGVYCTVAI